jgi:hypothetical protein
VSFIVCVTLCLLCSLAWCVILCDMYFCVLYLIVVPLLSCKNQFADQLYNNSIQLFIIYVPSQQLQGQLQTQKSVDTIIIIIQFFIIYLFI